MKKLITLLITAALLLTMAVPTFADDGLIPPEGNLPGAGEEQNPNVTEPTEEPTEEPEEKPAPITRKPYKVKNVKVLKNGYRSLKVTWQADPTATKYQVYRATSKNGKYVLKKTTTKTSYSNIGITCGKTYWYKVRAVNAKGKGVFSVKKGNKVRPATGKITKVTIPKSGQVRVHWNKVAGATGYQVYRKRTDKTTWKLFKTVSNKSTSVTDKLLGNRSEPWGKGNGYSYDYKDMEYSWDYKVRAYRTVKGKRVYGYFSKSDKWVPDWTIEGIYEELWKYGESLTWTMHEVVPTYPEPNADYDYHVAKTDGSTYTLKHETGWNTDTEGDAGAVYTNPENGNTEKNASYRKHTPKNSNWDVLWPVLVHPYRTKASILKELKPRIKADLESLTWSNPLWWDPEYGDWSGVDGFTMYYEKYLNGYKMWLLW
ncbi:flagellin-like hook-associated protein FlgL [Clostridiales Family XIII bacterium PM5-7]